MVSSRLSHPSLWRLKSRNVINTQPSQFWGAERARLDQQQRLNQLWTARRDQQEPFSYLAEEEDDDRLSVSPRWRFCLAATKGQALAENS